MNILLAATAEILKFETALLVLALAGLLVLSKMVSDLRSEVRRLRDTPAAPNRQTLTPSPLAAPAAPQEEISEAVFAAIVAAVYHTLGDQHQIISVSPAESLMWSREGRRSIFRSHTFR